MNPAVPTAYLDALPPPTAPEFSWLNLAILVLVGLAVFPLQKRLRESISNKRRERWAAQEQPSTDHEPAPEDHQQPSDDDEPEDPERPDDPTGDDLDPPR